MRRRGERGPEAATSSGAGSSPRSDASRAACMCCWCCCCAGVPQSAWLVQTIAKDGRVSEICVTSGNDQNHWDTDRELESRGSIPRAQAWRARVAQALKWPVSWQPATGQKCAVGRLPGSQEAARAVCGGRGRPRTACRWIKCLERPDGSGRCWRSCFKPWGRALERTKKRQTHATRGEIKKNLIINRRNKKKATCCRIFYIRPPA